MPWYPRILAAIKTALPTLVPTQATNLALHVSALTPCSDALQDHHRNLSLRRFLKRREAGIYRCHNRP